MIEITHKQAQRMIREQQDRQLPDEQWAMLQAHLENCPDCSAYQDRLGNYTHHLARILRARWGSVRGPRVDIQNRVMKIINRRKKFRHTVIRLAPWVFGVMLFIGFITYRNLTAPELPTLPTPTLLFGFVPAQTQAPTTVPLDFRGLTAFESRRDGNAEIYLLKISTKGPELTNLTENPADDTDPTWSPDGEWIAFLSNRTGKNEVYMMHISGSRLTQLTTGDQIDWRGPLEWSGDGKYIGLRGKRIDSGSGLVRSGLKATEPDARLYLVPIDGTQPLSLAATYGAKLSLRFSSSQNGFAFAGTRPQDSLIIGNSINGWTGNVTREDSQTADLSPILDGAFDWSLGGRNLVYVINSLKQFNGAGAGSLNLSEIRFSQDLEVGDHLNFTGAGAETIDSVAAPERFKAVSWMPHSLVVASLVGNDTDNCFIVRLKNAYNYIEPAQEFPGLCVEGGLSSRNWSEDGNWLILLGRKPRETQMSLYALHLPDFDAIGNPPRGTLGATTIDLEKLLDLKDEPVSNSNNTIVQSYPLWAEPHVRPSGQLLRIIPKSADVKSLPAEHNKNSFFTGGSSSWVVFSTNDGQNSQIVRMHPDGTQRMTLTGSPREHTCPRLSPDGKTIAYLSAEEGMRVGVNEVYRMDLDGNNVKMLTNGFVVSAVYGNRTTPFPRYDCPVWSPNGQWLAAILRLEYGNYLAIIPADGKSAVSYLELETVSSLSSPVWISNSPKDQFTSAEDILLIYPQGVKPARLMAVKLSGLTHPLSSTSNSEETAVPAVVEEKLRFIGWHDIEGLTLSPDGNYLAGIVEYLGNLRDANNTGNSLAELRVFGTDNFELVGTEHLINFDAQYAGRGSVFWFPDNWVGIARVVDLIGSEKTIFERYSADRNFHEKMASFEDTISRPALNQGNQVLFTAESGLWSINLGMPGAVPRLLSDESVFDLDWR